MKTLSGTGRSRNRGSSPKLPNESKAVPEEDEYDEYLAEYDEDCEMLRLLDTRRRWRGW